MKELRVKVLENVPVAAGVNRLTFSLPEAVEGLRCGRFVNLSVGDGAHLLRRPIAICEYSENTVTVCYQIKGAGTRLLAQRRAGDMLSCVLPLGNGFVLRENEQRVALIGGGVGVFPMLSVLHAYKGSGRQFYSYIGFRNKAAVCAEEAFKALSACCAIVTDDGSYGAFTASERFGGLRVSADAERSLPADRKDEGGQAFRRMNAVAAFFEDAERAKPDVILACGPLPMLRVLKAGLAERGLRVPCYVSLEERMGCGIGACLVCVCDTEGGEHARVCKDGPVFSIGEVKL